MNRKQQIITALRAFVAQRSGIEFCNYGDIASFRAEQRAITRDGKEARELLRAIEWRDSITADDILKAARGAYSGRLSIVERDDGAIAIDYCTGQYFPTEYRRAVCAVMASCLWDYMRDSMPEPEYQIGDGVKFKTESEAREYAEKMHTEQNCVLGIEKKYNGKSAGQWLRDHFKREYGRGIASRWFN